MSDQHYTAELRRTAHHEAGHMVAAQAFGRPIVSHSIDYNGNGARVNFWPTARNAEVLRQSLVILCAGPVASMIFDPTADRGDQDDASQLIETGWTLCGRLVDADVHHHECQLAERRAAKLIRDNWAHVDNVARSLLAHHWLVANGPTVSCVEDLDGA